MSKVRIYIENYTIYRKLSDVEWNKLRGNYNNKKLYEITNDEIKKVLNSK